MEYWFGKSKEELYKNTEAVNSDVFFFVSQASPVMHSGIHIYGSQEEQTDSKKNLVNIIAGGELVSYQLLDEYLKEGTAQESTGGYLLIKHQGTYQISNEMKELRFYVLYTHLLPVKYYYFVKTDGQGKTYTNEVSRETIPDFEFFKYNIGLVK